MRNYCFAYFKTKNDINIHLLTFYCVYYIVYLVACPFHCLKCQSVQHLKKLYLTTSEIFHERLLGIFHTKEMRNLFTNSSLF